MWLLLLAVSVAASPQCDYTCLGCASCYECTAWAQCGWTDGKCSLQKSLQICTYPHPTECSSTPTDTSYSLEHVALHQLAASTGGHTWFDSSINHCALPAVFCEANCSGPVTRLLLSNMSLSGSVPIQELTQLPQLKYAHFDQNSISGMPFHSMFSLGLIEGLFFAHNKMSGSALSVQGDIALIRLTLNGNQFSGTLSQLSALSNRLEFARLQYCAFSGALPAELAMMTSLQQLVVHSNRLSASIPADTLASLTSLQAVSLAQNSISGNFPRSTQLCILIVARSTHNSCGGRLSESSAVRALYLNSNRLSGTMSLGLLESFIGMLQPLVLSGIQFVVCSIEQRHLGLDTLYSWYDPYIFWFQQGVWHTEHGKWHTILGYQ